jgi:hypothetical protein
LLPLYARRLAYRRILNNRAIHIGVAKENIVEVTMIPKQLENLSNLFLEAKKLRTVALESIETIVKHDKVHDKQKTNPFLKYHFYVRLKKKT